MSATRTRTEPTSPCAIWQGDSVHRGIWINPDNPAADVVSAIEELDRSGVDQVWIGDEGVARDPFVLLGVAASRTERIELGLGVTNPILRHPGVVASAASTIAEMSGERFILGWGTGGEESLAPFSLRCVAPVATLERAIETSRAVLTGRSIGGYARPHHSVPPRSVRQYIGARGPRLNGLASRVADGVFLSGIPIDDLPSTVDIARGTSTIEVALYQTVRTTGSEAPGIMVGTAAAIADRIGELCEQIRPTSVGVACIDDLPLLRSLELSMDILQRIPHL